jgi:hypothetical protein
MVFVFGMLNYGLTVCLDQTLRDRPLTSGAGQIRGRKRHIRIHISYCTIGSISPARRHRSYPLPRMQEPDLHGAPHAAKRHHPVR